MAKKRKTKVIIGIRVILRATLSHFPNTCKFSREFVEYTPDVCERGEAAKRLCVLGLENCNSLLSYRHVNERWLRLAVKITEIFKNRTQALHKEVVGRQSFFIAGKQFVII